MKKTLENIEEIIINVLSFELTDSSLLTKSRVRKIAEDYFNTGKIELPESIYRSMATYEVDPEPPGIEALQHSLDTEFNRYAPTRESIFEANAEIIKVKIHGREFDTFVDFYGTQRFKTDAITAYMFKNKLIDLGALEIAYQEGKFSSEDWLDFHARSGNSVENLANLSDFSHLSIESPLW